MKAFILAAGYGTRLEPLTIAVPKPMVPIVNLPTMQHNIELLKKYDLTEITANIHYHPEQIENYFGDGQAFGVNLSYSFEETLLGTAGGVKKMAQNNSGDSEPFVVLSSDALTDINLGRLIEYHQEKKALATIALAKVKETREFGIVVQDGEGQIMAFQEKPKTDEAKSNLANTGIYIFDPRILELIPDGPYDFGQQLFPKLVAERAAIYGYQMVEYWNDVGGLDKYIQSNYDAMKGLVQIKIPGKKAAKSTWLGERQQIDTSARFEGSVIIGDRCRIGKDVYIKDAVVGDKCLVEDGAIITGSVVWSDSVVHPKAQIENAVIGAFCHIGAGAKIQAGTIIANRCVIRSGAEVTPQTRLKPDITY